MLTKDKLLHCLARLGDELAKQGLEGEILLTGGASMCLVHSARDMTKDVDALYEPKGDINRIVKLIAQQEDLPDNWLNDSVKGFVTETVQAEDFLKLNGLHITTVSADYLLAMKLVAARYGEKDYEDIKFLMKKLEVDTSEKAHDVVTRFYPPEKIPPKTKYLINQLVNEIKPRNRGMSL